MAVMAAIDLGAQSGRVALGRFDGDRLSLSEVHRFANVPVAVQGMLHWDVLRLYHDVLDGLRAAGRAAAVESVAVDGWGVDFALLDRRDRLVRNPVHYRDARRAAAVDHVLSLVPARELYQRTGIQLMPINSVFELGAMAAERDPALEAAATLLLLPDLFHHWLCGSGTTELTNATTTQCFDPLAGAWAGDLLERIGIEPGLMPDVVAPATRLGPITAEVAAATGLERAIVVATATHDTGSAVAGVPFGGAEAAFLSVGTWSLVGIEAGRPIIDERSFAANLTNEGGVGGTFRILRNVTGLWLVEECRRTWQEQGREHSFDELVALARRAPAHRAFIDPNHPSFAAPGDMPGRIRDFCARTGQPEPEGAGETVRCVLESLALKHADTVDLLRDVTGRDPEVLHVVGGGARNELLCEWTAGAAARPVLAGPEESTLIGNLLVQAMALGEIASLAEGREVVRASFTPRAFEPGDADAWREARGRFAGVTREAAALEVPA
jgi:rhamnulokinase